MNGEGYYIIENTVDCTAEDSTFCTMLKSRRLRWDWYAAWRVDIKYNLIRNFFEMVPWKMDTTRVIGYCEYRALPQIHLWTRIPPWSGFLFSRTWKDRWPTGSSCSRSTVLCLNIDRGRSIPMWMHSLEDPARKHVFTARKSITIRQARGTCCCCHHRCLGPCHSDKGAVGW